jgi:flagellar protein FliO/FliZ
MGKGRVNVLGGVSLGAREKAVLLTVEGRRLLVGVAPGQVSTLMVLDEEAETPADFEAQLRAVSDGTADTSSDKGGR